MKYKIFCSPIPNLGYRVYIVITWDFKMAVKKIFQDNSWETIKPNARALACHRDNRTYVFFKPDADAAEIAHEMWHAVRRMLDYIGADLENEVVAYNLEYLVAQGVSVLKKWAKKISK